jgi:hypothetical protein
MDSSMLFNVLNWVKVFAIISKLAEAHFNKTSANRLACILSMQLLWVFKGIEPQFSGALVLDAL